MEQPIPNATLMDVERVVRRDFPEHRVAEVLLILEEYGDESSPRGQSRVRLAALKLADGNIEQLWSEIDRAKNDFRDVIVQAEYPGHWERRHELDSGHLPLEEESRIINADWKNYQDWLTR